MGRVETVISLPILQLWMAGIVIGFLKQTNNKPRADSHDIKYRQFEDAIKLEFVSKQGTRIERTEKEIAIATCGFYTPNVQVFGFDFLWKCSK